MMMTLIMVGLTACASGGGGRYYDEDHHDYHTWNSTEITFYGTWENETHRPHVDYDRRRDDERREYWNWRHNHDRDHDDRH
jgi:hypothetical protein